MKSKCSFMFKAGIALILAFVMLFGTVATSLAAVVDDLAETGYDSYALHTQYDGSNSSSWWTSNAVNSGGTITVNYKDRGFHEGDEISFGVKGNSSDWMAYGGGGVMHDGDKYYFNKRNGDNAKLYLSKPIVKFTFTTSGSGVDVKLTMEGSFSATAKLQTGVTGGTATLNGGTADVTVDSGSTVSLVATPGTSSTSPYVGAPYVFERWTATPSGNATFSGTDKTSVTASPTVNGNVTFAPVFAKQSYTVTDGEGANGTLTIGGLTDGKAQWGESVSLTATPNVGYYLSSIVYNDGSNHDVLRFASHDAEGYKESGSFKMPAHDATVTATFSKLPAETVDYGVVGEGYVSVGEAYNDGTEYKKDEIVRTIPQNTEVEPDITHVNYCAIPKKGYKFIGWYNNDPTCAGDPDETDANITVCTDEANGYKYYAKFEAPGPSNDDLLPASNTIRMAIASQWPDSHFIYAYDDTHVPWTYAWHGNQLDGLETITYNNKTYYYYDFADSSNLTVILNNSGSDKTDDITTMENGKTYFLTYPKGTDGTKKNDDKWGYSASDSPGVQTKDIYPVILNVTNPEKGEENKTHVKAYCEAGQSVNLYTSPKDYKKVSATQDVSTAKLTDDKTKNNTTSVTMPSTAGTTSTTLAVVYEDYEQFSITYGSSGAGTGTVTATSASGQVIPSGSKVLEGTNVTFTATANNGSWFSKWSDDETDNPYTIVNVTSDIDLNAIFVANGYKFVYRTDDQGNTTETNMKMLENGWYISTSTAGNNCHFSIYHTATTEYCDSGATGTDGWYISSKYSENKTGVAGKWTTDSLGTSNAQDFFKNTTGDACYVVYDPATDSLWLTTEEDGLESVTVWLKDGTIRLKNNNTELYTDADHILTCQIGTSSVTNEDISTTDHYLNHCHKFTVSASDLRDGIDIGIQTVVNNTYKTSYYVKGFAVNDGLTQGLISQEFDEDTKNELANYPDRDKVHGKTGVNGGNPYNEFTLHLEGITEKNIEITPIYFKICDKSNDTIRFYATDFGGQVKKDWGGTLSVFSFSDAQNCGIYPGQPMVNEGGRYMMDIPTSDHSVTMNNYVYDIVHHDIYNYGVTESTINYQTYDYNEFDILHQIFDASHTAHSTDPSVIDLSDEDIIFSFKYRNDQTNHGTKANSQLADSVQYKAGNDPLKTGQSWYGGSYNSTWDYATNYQTIDPNNSIYEFEDLTDFYGNRIDMFGDHVDVRGNDVKKTYNPILAVSNGYDYNKAGDFATAWALYKPENLTGDPGTYTLFDVIGGQGVFGSDSKPYYGSESYFIEPDWADDIRAKYGADTTNPKHIYDLERVPVKISYEFNIKDGRANHSIDTKTDPGDVGYRSDGHWDFTTSDQILKANVIIALKDGENFTRDYFNASGYDYTSGENYDSTQNTGYVTGIKAYFDNDNYVEGEFEGSEHQNVPGLTEAYALSDGVHTFNLRCEDDPEGNYEFLGWYLYNGKDYFLASEKRNYDTEARSNDVFAAVYRKVPSGKVTISHSKDSTSTGGGDYKATISIVPNTSPSDGERNTLVTDTLDSFSIGSKYIKYNSTNYIEIVLKTEPDDNSRFDTTYGFYENIGNSDSQVTAGSTVSGITNSTATVDTANRTATIYIPIAKLFNAETEEQTIFGLPFLSKIIGMGTYQFVYKDRNNEDAVYHVKVDLKTDEVNGYSGNGNQKNVPTYIWTSEAQTLYNNTNPVTTALGQIDTKIGSYKREIHFDVSDSTKFTPNSGARNVTLTATCPVEQFNFKYTLKGESEVTYGELVTYNQIVTFNPTYADAGHHYINREIPRTITENGVVKEFSYWSSDEEGNKPLTTNITFGMLITDGITEEGQSHDTLHVYAQYGRFLPEAPLWQPNFEEVKQTRKIDNDKGYSDIQYIDYLVNYVNKDDKRIQNLVGSEVSEYGIVVLKGDVDYEGTENNAMEKMVDAMVFRNLSAAKKTLNGETFLAYRFAYDDATHTSSFNRTDYIVSGNFSTFSSKHFTAMAYIKTSNNEMFYTPVDFQTVVSA